MHSSLVLQNFLQYTEYSQLPFTTITFAVHTVLTQCLYLCTAHLQYIEYSELPFTITDSPYGTTFYITTGFHGMHVLLGAIFLACAAGAYSRTKTHGVMMKSSILYWHFVGECPC